MKKKLWLVAITAIFLLNTISCPAYGMRRIIPELSSSDSQPMSQKDKQHIIDVVRVAIVAAITQMAEPNVSFPTILHAVSVAMDKNEIFTNNSLKIKVACLQNGLMYFTLGKEGETTSWAVIAYNPSTKTTALEPANEYSGTVDMAEFRNWLDQGDLIMTNAVIRQIIGAVNPVQRKELLKELLIGVERDRAVFILKPIMELAEPRNMQVATNTLEILIGLQDEENTKIADSARVILAELSPEILVSEKASEEVKAMVVAHYQPLAGAFEKDYFKMVTSVGKSAEYRSILVDASLFFENGKPRLGIKEVLRKLDNLLPAISGKSLNIVVRDEETKEKIENILALEGHIVKIVDIDEAKRIIDYYLYEYKGIGLLNALVDGAYKGEDGWVEELEEKRPLRVTRIPEIKEGENRLRIVLFAVLDGFTTGLALKYEEYLRMFLSNNQVENIEKIVAEAKKTGFNWVVEMSSEDLEAYQRIEEAYQEGETAVTI